MSIYNERCQEIVPPGVRCFEKNPCEEHDKEAYDKSKVEIVRTENECMKALLQKYSDRCPCRPGAPCDLCDEASAYL